MTRATLAMVISPIVTGPLSPTWDGALWVGEVDRADVHASSHRDVVALEGAAGYRRARLLVRDHGEPLGFVEADITERRRIGGTIDVRTLQRAIRPMPVPERRPAAGLVLPSVTVVLCTDGAAGTTMRSVLANEYPDFDVVVVSHGADDSGTATVEIGGRSVTTIAAPTGGLAAARNAGLLAASGEVVAFVAEGAVVDGDWVAALATAFAADPDVACVTGLVPSAELRTPAQRWHDDRTAAGRTVRRRVFRLDDTDDAPPHHPFAAAAYGTGDNLAVHRATALRIGGFDTAFGPGTRVGAGDDLDLFPRLLFAGSAIAVEPAAIAWQRSADDVASLRAAAAAHGHGLGAWMTKNAIDRESLTASVDAAPEALSAFARLGLEQGDRATDIAGDQPGDADRVPDAVDAEFAATQRRLRGVEQRSVLTAPFLALVERLRGGGTIDRNARGRHELRHGLASAGPARPLAVDAMSPIARLTAAAIVVLTLLVAGVAAIAGLPVLRGVRSACTCSRCSASHPCCSSARCRWHASASSRSRRRSSARSASATRWRRSSSGTPRRRSSGSSCSPPSPSRSPCHVTSPNCSAPASSRPPRAPRPVAGPPPTPSPPARSSACSSSSSPRSRTSATRCRTGCSGRSARPWSSDWRSSSPLPSSPWCAVADSRSRSSCSAGRSSSHRPSPTACPP
ncbi:glycosyltransferase [Sphingomonas sp. LR61]|uniref:glycosyltransferase n=1 Tax=Sphingomonas sp. LR61 TaxID=3050234 RepID=UPI002FE05B22